MARTNAYGLFSPDMTQDPNVPRDSSRSMKDVDRALGAVSAQAVGAGALAEHVKDIVLDNLARMGVKVESVAQAYAQSMQGAAEQITALQEANALLAERLEAVEALGGLAPGESSDATTAALLAGTGTLTASALRQAVRQQVAREQDMTVIVEDFATEGGTDDAAWQAAIDSVSSLKGWTVRGTKATYRFTQPVILPSCEHMTLEGAGFMATTFTVAEGTGELANLFILPVGQGGRVERLRLRNFSVDGGMVSATPGVPERNERVFGEDKIAIPVRINGNLVANAEGEYTEQGSASVEHLMMEDVHIEGCEHLPVLFRGIENVTVERCSFERTMDPGFTYCKRVSVRDYSMTMGADNGLSLSRGCEEVFAENIRIHGTYIAGLHVGGYQPSNGVPEYGPRRAVLRSIFIEDAGERGISLVEGAENVDISGVYINGVHWGRGSRAYPDLGVGIEIRGAATSQGSGIEREPARNIRIHDFTIENTKNSGILATMVEGLYIQDGMIRNVGSPVTATGGQIKPSNVRRNIAIGASNNAPSSVRDFSIRDVRVIDDRETPYTNWAVFGYSGQADWRISGLTASGTRNTYVEVIPAQVVESLRVGTNSTPDSVMRINGSSSGEQILAFQKAGQTAWSIRVNGAGDLAIRDSQGATKVALSAEGDLRLFSDRIGFRGVAPRERVEVTGSRGQNQALTSLLIALNAQGLISDKTTAI